MALFKKKAAIVEEKKTGTVPVQIEELPSEIKEVKKAVEKESMEETEENEFEETEEQEEQPVSLTEARLIEILSDHEKRLKRIEYHNRLDFMD